MPAVHRRTTPRVRLGHVEKKHNWTPDRGDYFAMRQDEVHIDRMRPGAGFRHLVTVAQLRELIGMLPDWDEVAAGLNAIVLDAGSTHLMGWCRGAVVGVCAWEQELWWTGCDPWFEREHRAILDALGVERRPAGEVVHVRWTESQARAFQLLHILPHELGHHRDRMTSRRRRTCGRGEPYAEDYANTVLEAVLPAYEARFGI